MIPAFIFNLTLDEFGGLAMASIVVGGFVFAIKGDIHSKKLNRIAALIESRETNEQLQERLVDQCQSLFGVTSPRALSGSVSQK